MTKKPKSPKGEPPKPGSAPEDVVPGPPFDVPAAGAIDPFPGHDPFGVPGGNKAGKNEPGKSKPGGNQAEGGPLDPFPGKDPFGVPGSG